MSTDFCVAPYPLPLVCPPPHPQAVVGARRYHAHQGQAVTLATTLTRHLLTDSVASTAKASTPANAPTTRTSEHPPDAPPDMK